MRLYLDVCALKRPFDDQIQERVALETRAVLSIMHRVEKRLDALVWSAALTFENNADPDEEVRTQVGKVAGAASSSHHLTPDVEARLKELTTAGLPPLDAAHVAFAEAAKCDFLITCDDRLIRRATRSGCLIRVLNPIQYLQEVDHGG